MDLAFICILISYLEEQDRLFNSDKQFREEAMLDL